MTVVSDEIGAPRVLQVVGSLDTGGAEMMVLSAAEALAGRCTMDYLVFGGNKGTLESRALAAGGRVLRLPSPRQLGPRKFVRSLKSLLLDEHYDVVHSHVNLASGLVMKAAAGAAVPIRIAHSHSTSHTAHSLGRRAYRWLALQWISRYSTVFAACGEAAGHNLFGNSWAAGPGIVVPNGVNLDTFISVRDQSECTRSELGLSSGRRVIGMIARLVDFKNHAFMLDVLAMDKANSGDCTLLIIGDGPLRSALEQRIRFLDLSSRVKFLGLRDDVPRLLGALDWVAMPSLYEGLPVALVEAQAAGIPALVSDRVTPEGDLDLGLVSWLPLEDAAAWLRLFYTDPPRPDPSMVREKFAAAGYDIHSSANKLLELYVPKGSRK